MVDAWGGAFGDAWGVSWGTPNPEYCARPDAWGGTFGDAWGKSWGCETEPEIAPGSGSVGASASLPANTARRRRIAVEKAEEVFDVYQYRLRAILLLEG